VFLGLAATTLFSTCWAWRTIPQPIYRVRRQQFVEVTHRLPALTIIERALYLPRRLLFVLQPAHLRHLWQPVQSPLWRYLLATAVMFVSFTMALTPFPLFLQTTLELDTSLIFALVMVRALASVPCYEWAGRWVHHVGPKRVQSLSLAGRCLMFLVFWSLEWLSHPGITVSLLVSMNMLAGITWSLIAVSGPVLLGRLAGPGHKGKAMGMYNATQGGAQIIGAILGGYLAQWAGYYGLFAAAAMLLLPAIGLLASLRLAPEPSTPLMQRADTQTHKQSNQVSIERSL
jgi:predicted MFS family arabinose efflux permease